MKFHLFPFVCLFSVTVNITVIYSFWSAMFEVLLLLSLLEQFACTDTFDIVWAEQPERELLRGDENMVAFRDIAFEVMMRKIFETYIVACKQSENSWVPESWRLKEPHEIPSNVNFDKKIEGLLDVKFSAWNIRISGLPDIVVEQFHFIRHVGRW